MASVSMAKSKAKVPAVLELLLKPHVLLGYYYFCSVLLIKLPISCTYNPETLKICKKYCYLYLSTLWSIILVLKYFRKKRNVLVLKYKYIVTVLGIYLSPFQSTSPQPWLACSFPFMFILYLSHAHNVAVAFLRDLYNTRLCSLSPCTAGALI